MPGYGYGGGGNPFEQGFQNGAGFINNALDVNKHIQDAYIQREANARAQAKQQHDLAVDDLETRMKLLGSGAQPLAADGTTGISGQIAQAATQPGAVVQPDSAGPLSVPGGLPDSMAQAPPQLPPQQAPDMSAAQNIMSAGTGYQGKMAADPNLTVRAPDGTRYQLPSLQQRAQMQDATAASAARAAGDKSRAEEGGKKQADADDLAKNGIAVPDPLADYLGLPRGQKATLSNLHQMVQDTSARKHNETMAAVASARELDTQRGLDIQQQRADASDRRTDALDARVSAAGGGDGKPATKAQLIGIETRKQQGLADAQKQFSKDLSGASVGGVVDAGKVKDAQDALNDSKQRVQNAYESELQTAGVGTSHFDYSQQQPAAKPAAAPASAAKPAASAPAAAPAPTRPGPPPEVAAKMQVGVATPFKGGKGTWIKNQDGTLSRVRGT